MKQALSVLMVCALTATAGAAVFTDDFDDGNAATRFSAPFFSSETGSMDGLVDYAFDYSTIGLPAAPNSPTGSTIGLGIQVNNTDDPIDEGEAIGVSPIINGLSGDYVVTADVFIRYQGGSGSSEHAVIGLNSDRAGVPFTFVTGGAEGTYYHIPHNSGLTTQSYFDDYYKIVDGTISGIAGNRPDLPDALSLGIPYGDEDPNDFPIDDPGYPRNQWFEVELSNIGDVVTLKINGATVDSFDNSGGTTSGDIVLGGADIFNSANNTNWIVFDNVNVVPEPASLVLLALGGLAIIRRR